MATKIIVDGYNLLACIWSMVDFSRSDIPSIREKLLRKLASYQIYKKHQLTVVFDASQGGMPVTRQDKFLGVRIIYTKLGETADQLIKKMLDRNEEGLVIVTSDRQIADWAREKNVVVVSSREFAAKMELASSMEDKGVEEGETHQKPLSTKKKGNPRKLPRLHRLHQSLKKKL